MMFLSVVFTGVFSYVYKSIGLSEGISDRVLAWAGSVSAAVQAATRVIVGSLYDRYGFKSIFYFLMFINVAVSFCCYQVRENTPLFFIAI
jgi:MFS family permease